MNDFFTLKEIYQQESLWLRTLSYIEIKKKEIENFLISCDFKSRKIIFVGAGTSEFIGNILFPYFGKNFTSIGTTDIVTNPENYFEKDKKTLLVSFARSGNSPESLEVIKLADYIIDDVHHILITCNEQGAISLCKKNDKKTFIFLTPEKSNDLGFAMTSSFTCMLLSAISIFNLNKISEIKDFMFANIKSLEKSKESLKKFAKSLVIQEKNRYIYLGSSPLLGLANEASLKLLELTGGKVNTFYNSPLGFRHGPKSIVNNSTMIFIFLSNEEHARKYEIDVINELKDEKNEKTLVVLDMKFSKNLKEKVEYYFSFENEGNFESIFNSFSYIYFAQLFAYYKSISFGINPDNPCPTGEVNRVVKGVIIHEYKK